MTDDYGLQHVPGKSATALARVNAVCDLITRGREEVTTLESPENASIDLRNLLLEITRETMRIYASSPIDKRAEACSEYQKNAYFKIGYRFLHGDGVAQDIGIAEEYTRRAAEQGHIWAQHNLGYIYEFIMDEEGEFEKLAAYWYQQAANQGYSVSQYALGKLLYFGIGVEKDHDQAVMWYRKAAEQNFVEAQYSLAMHHSLGKDREQNYTESAKWFRKAAEQGDPRSQFYLGLQARDGEGMPRDFVEAYFWMTLAYEANSKDLVDWKQGELLAQIATHLSPSELSQAKERVRQWTEKHLSS